MATVTSQSNAGRIEKYLTRIQEQEASPHPYILHYDSKAGKLRPWLWPENEAGEKVTPSALPSFRADGFRRPCCFCSIPGPDGIGIGYKESSVYMSVDAEDFGEYFIACRDRKCVYEVRIQRSYDTPGLPTKRFYSAQRRSQSLRRHAKKIEMRSPPGDSTFVKLLRLDAAGRPGLPEEEFFQLFTMCRQCHWIMTRSTFHNHKCLTPRIVIDLTSDSDD